MTGGVCQEFEAELLLFPIGAHDDMVDSLAGFRADISGDKVGFPWSYQETSMEVTIMAEKSRD